MTTSQPDFHSVSNLAFLVFDVSSSFNVIHMQKISMYNNVVDFDMDLLGTKVVCGDNGPVIFLP
jgi:hypothetical protein